MEETGLVRVFVTEANGTIPVKGAAVTITEYGPESEGDTVRTLVTGRDGLTETVRLPTPPAEDSLSPGSRTPSGLYGITVRSGGYYPVEAVGVPVFPGVVSLQTVDLIPIGAFPGPFASGQIVIYETPENTSLLPGSQLPGAGREDIGENNGVVSGGVMGEGTVGSGARGGRMERTGRADQADREERATRAEGGSV